MGLLVEGVGNVGIVEEGNSVVLVLFMVNCLNTSPLGCLKTAISVSTIHAIPE